MLNMLTETHVSHLFAAIILITFMAAVAAELVNFIPEMIADMIKRIRNKSIIEQRDLLTLQQENVLELKENMDTTLDRADLGNKFMKPGFFNK